MLRMGSIEPIGIPLDIRSGPKGMAETVVRIEPELFLARCLRNHALGVVACLLFGSHGLAQFAGQVSKGVV